jgi:adenylate cyclase
MAGLRSETPLFVTFIDLARFMAQSQRVDDAELANTLDAYYERIAAAVGEAGGTLVKFIGDAALVVFPEDDADRAVRMLLDLKTSIDAMMADRGWECRFTAKAHVGPVIAGPFGAAGAKSYDVIGKTVNTAATLEATGVTLSVAAFRKLSPELRTHFRKHTAPIVYIRQEDPRRFR